MHRNLSDSEKKLIGMVYVDDFTKVLNELLLSDMQKKIFILYYHRQMSIIEIGVEVNRDRKTVAKELKEIVLKLDKYKFTEENVINQ